VPSTYDAAMSASDDVSSGPPENIRQFVVVFYTRTPAGMGEGDEDEVFAGHMRYLNHLAATGLCPISGPFGDDEPLRGLSIYDSTSVDEIETLVATDPAVVAKWMTAEVRPWWGVGGTALPS
jgi:uncharacterized protein YciI